MPCQGSAQMLLTLPDERCARCVWEFLIISQAFYVYSLEMGYKVETGYKGTICPRRKLLQLQIYLITH